MFPRHVEDLRRRVRADATDRSAWVGLARAWERYQHLPFEDPTPRETVGLARTIRADAEGPRLARLLGALQGFAPAALRSRWDPPAHLAGVIRRKDRARMTFVPATDDEPAFWLDVRAITRARYQRFMDRTGREEHGWWTVTGPQSVYANQMVADEAAAYATWVGGCLPSSSMWTRALEAGFLGSAWDRVLGVDLQQWTSTLASGRPVAHGFSPIDQRGSSRIPDIGVRTIGLRVAQVPGPPSGVG
jgi:hypothetical protein